MGYFVRQLDGSQFAGDNCGPAAVASALRWATKHKIAPTPSAVRKRMRDFDGGTQPADQPKAWQSFERQAESLGFTLRPMKYRSRADWDRFVAALKDGFAGTVAVDYSKVPNDLKGDPMFNGGHAIFVAKLRDIDGSVSFKVYDPLCDGRRSGIPGPGPVWWPERVLRRAAAGYAGDGSITFNRVEKSVVIDPPDRPGGCTEVVDQLLNEIGALRDVLGTARSSLVALGDITSGAVADIDEVLPANGDTGDAPVTGLMPE